MKETIWGISAGHHDAAISVVNEYNDILFAGHAERYSRIKNDPNLNIDLVYDAIQYGGLPDRIVWYEKYLSKWWRQIRTKDWARLAFTKSPREHLKPFRELKGVPLNQVSHHHSHAAGGYYTSPFNHAAVLVIDAIGEWETTTIWFGLNDKLEKIKSWKYPKSLGLQYSAYTQEAGYEPNKDEHKLMAESGLDQFAQHHHNLKPHYDDWLTKNFHKGEVPFQKGYLRSEDIACISQTIYEGAFKKLLLECRNLSPNLVLSGGCALNCTANQIIEDVFDDCWIMPNPGDAGSSLGAVAAYRQTKLNWNGPYLGHDIGSKGKYPIDEIIKALKKQDMAGVAYGRAEFGPRALGHRSLFALPHTKDIKQKINKLKGREEWMPLAAMIPSWYVDELFHPQDFNIGRRIYMQYTSQFLPYTSDDLKSIQHEDNTCRIQVINNQLDNLDDLLHAVKREFDVPPILINTSLNLKDEPIVNNRNDKEDFEYYAKIPVV